MTIRPLVGVVGFVLFALGVVGSHDDWAAPGARWADDHLGDVTVFCAPGIAMLGIGGLAWATFVARLERARRVRLAKALCIAGMAAITLGIVGGRLLEGPKGEGLVFMMALILVSQPGVALLAVAALLLVLDAV